MYLIILLSLLFISGCSGVLIESTPSKAIVSILDPKSSSYKKIGETPLEVSGLIPNIQEPIVQLKIEYESLLPSYIAFPKETSGNLIIQAQLADKNAFYQKAQELTADLYSIQSNIQQGEYQIARTLLKKFTTDHYSLAIGWLYMAELNILENKTKLAISNLKKALVLKPKLKQAQTMLNSLESIR